MDNDRAFNGRLRDDGAHPLAAIVVLGLGTVIGVGLLAPRGQDDTGVTIPQATSSPPISRTHPSAASSPLPPPVVRTAQAIGPGVHSIQHNNLLIRMTVPSGWNAANDEPAIFRTPAAFLRFHDVAGVVGDVCAPDPALEVGPSAGELVNALSEQVGIERVGPKEVIVGGHPATRFILYTQWPCVDPEGLLILEDVDDPFGLAIFGLSAVTVYVVDVAGERLVISTDRSTQQNNAELDAIVASMTIDRKPSEPLHAMAFPKPGQLAPGWYPARANAAGSGSCCSRGPEFFYELTSRGWIAESTGEGEGAFSIAKGTLGSSDSARIHFSNPSVVYADPCNGTPAPPPGTSVADLATAMTGITGADATVPTRIALRFSTATHVVLSVREDVACDLGDLVLWSDGIHGPRRPSAPGSTFRIWAFHPNDRPGFGRIVIEAETFEHADIELVREIDAIVQSIFHGG